MKAIEQLRERLALIGATLDDGEYSLHCDAPKGYIWRANGTPTLSIHYATNSQSWLVEAIRMEMPNLKMGLEKVTDPAELAEIRHNQDDDTWGAPENAPERIEFV
jgi:hypothetical protein